MVIANPPLAEPVIDPGGVTINPPFEMGVANLGNPGAAENTVKGIRKQINSLINFPERNELDEDEILAELGVRKDYYKNYKIYYVISGDTIYIVRILHMLVDSRAWLYRTFGL